MSAVSIRLFHYTHVLVAVAISQRHPSKYYSHLQQSSGEDTHLLVIVIQKFFCRYVQKRFNDGKVNRYVLDLYVDSQERVWIVDFNVWGSRTDGLLFDWKELSNLGLNVNNRNNHRLSTKPEYRVVTKDMKSVTYDPLSSFRGPTDVMDFLGQNNGNSDGFEDSPSFESFMKQCVRPSEL